MESILLTPILIPIIAGLGSLCIVKRRVGEMFALSGMSLTLIASLFILLSDTLRLQIDWIHLSYFQLDLDFISFHLSKWILTACSFFGLLITLYSLKQMEGKAHLKPYYIFLLWTVGFANGAVLSNNLIVLLLFWGMIAIMLYLLIMTGGMRAQKAAQKSFIIVGGSDFLMLLGVVIIWRISGSLSMTEISIPIKGVLPTIAFLLLMTGAITKAGAMPFHSWIPDAAEVSPTPVMAFLPAALDKLLGIYLLVRLVLGLFVLNISMKMLLMSIGAVTIIAAVMMALIQKDLKKLLSFHAISQVGYMVLGIGTGTAVGIAGGLFHMLNHAIYKCCLFLCSGAVEYRTKTTRLENLGGLGRAMPVTFVTCAIAALSISGVPPFNGFISKWMVYQGTIDFGGSVWPLFLVIAMFGSALTMASFVKVIHSVFLGQKPKEIRAPKEVAFSMKIPMVILALLCVVLGIFVQLPLNYFIGPVVGMSFGGFGEAVQLSGLWSPTLTTLLLLLSLFMGVLFYRLGNVKTVKEGEIFVGGEPIDEEEVRIPGTHFYDTIESTGFLRILYEKGKARAFDIYEWGRRGIGLLSRVIYHKVDRMVDRFYDGIRVVSLELSRYVRKAHTGILTTYLFWFLLGAAVLLLILMK
ncbi:MAG: NADH-quinone oxidoreductase subunit L [bacterium]